MKKAVILRSKQYVLTDQESPTVNLYFWDTLFVSYPYVQFRNGSQRFFIKKWVMEDIESRVYYGGLSYDMLMKALKLGASFGVYDLREKFFHKAVVGPEAEAEQRMALFKLSSGRLHQDYTIESIIDPINFGTRDGLLYSKITYQEAQFIEVWLHIIEHHKDFEPIFSKDYEEYLKREGVCDMRTPRKK